MNCLLSFTIFILAKNKYNEHMHEIRKTSDQMDKALEKSNTSNGNHFLLDYRRHK